MRLYSNMCTYTHTILYHHNIQFVTCTDDHYSMEYYIILYSISE